MVDTSFSELRLYEVEPGRMDDMVARYHGPLQVLFGRHGIRPAAAWRSSGGPRSPLFVYLMHWRSLEERTAAWNGFYADPEWARVRTETNRGSELVERYDLNFLREIVPLTPGEAREIELYTARVRIGAGGPARTWIQDEAPAVLQFSRARLLGAYEHLTGNDLPRVSLFLSWNDDEARRQALQALEVAPLERADRYSLIHL
jgi:hypothetical protein